MKKMYQVRQLFSLCLMMRLQNYKQGFSFRRLQGAATTYSFTAAANMMPPPAPPATLVQAGSVLSDIVQTTQRQLGSLRLPSAITVRRRRRNLTLAAASALGDSKQLALQLSLIRLCYRRSAACRSSPMRRPSRWRPTTTRWRRPAPPAAAAAPPATPAPAPPLAPLPRTLFPVSSKRCLGGWAAAGRSCPLRRAALAAALAARWRRRRRRQEGGTCLQPPPPCRVRPAPLLHITLPAFPLILSETATATGRAAARLTQSRLWAQASHPCPCVVYSCPYPRAVADPVTAPSWEPRPGAGGAPTPGYAGYVTLTISTAGALAGAKTQLLWRARKRPVCCV